MCECSGDNVDLKNADDVSFYSFPFSHRCRKRINEESRAMIVLSIFFDGRSRSRELASFFLRVYVYMCASINVYVCVCVCAVKSSRKNTVDE